jgi:hypothetical protein
MGHLAATRVNSRGYSWKDPRDRAHTGGAYFDFDDATKNKVLNLLRAHQEGLPRTYIEKALHCNWQAMLLVLHAHNIPIAEETIDGQVFYSLLEGWVDHN